MRYRNLTLIAIVSVLSTTLLFTAFLITYKIDPAILGLPRSNEIIEMDYPIEISSKKLKELEKKSALAILISEQYDSLNSSYKLIQDSLRVKKNELKILSDSSQKFFEIISEKQNEANKLRDSLEKIKIKYNLAENEISNLKTKLAETQQILKSRKDSLQEQHYRVFAKIYNNSNPADVAKILEKIDERDASQILKFMNQKKAGKVIEALDPKIAAAILLLSN